MLKVDDDLPDHVYVPDGEAFVPSDVARSPWFAEAQHGAPVAALVHRVLEDCDRDPDGPPQHLARVTIDFLRPVPFGPLRAKAELIKGGRRVQFVEATLFADDVEVVHATAARLTQAPLALVDEAGVPIPETDSTEPPPPAPETVAPHEWSAEITDSCWWMAFGCALDRRIVRGSFERPGGAAMWTRLLMPFLAGSENRPGDLLFGGAADWPMALSSMLPFSRFLYPNVDITVHTHRPPQGEWICADATSWNSGDGNALAQASLHDGTGRIGTAMQTAVLSPR